MKVYFISNILPMKVVHEMNRSLAGARFQSSFANELYIQMHGDVDFLSVVRSGHKEAKQICNSVLFENKKYERTYHISKPFLDELFLYIQVFFKSLRWCLRNYNEDPVIIVLNSPNEVISPVLLLKKMGLCRVYSFLIDSPFTDKRQSSAYLRWKKKQFSIGLSKLNNANGAIFLNKTVKEILHLTIPIKTVLLGLEPFDIAYDPNHYDDLKYRKKRLMYAGTLSEVNGTKQMLDAFSMLSEDEYQIDICGFGPQEQLVNSYCQSHKNCVFHGRVDQNELNDLYSKADLMMNIRLRENEDNDYSFPSKLISYLYSGTLVVSSNFSSLPDDYRDFLFVTNDDKPRTIVETIKNVFKYDPLEMNQRALNGRNYVIEKQAWNTVVKEIIDFLEDPQGA